MPVRSELPLSVARAEGNEGLDNEPDLPAECGAGYSTSETSALGRKAERFRLSDRHRSSMPYALRLEMWPGSREAKALRSLSLGGEVSPSCLLWALAPL